MHQRKAASITIIIFLLLISTAAEAVATAADAGGRLRFIKGRASVVDTAMLASGFDNALCEAAEAGDVAVKPQNSRCH